MSTTSKKHASFVSEPMGEKEVTEIAGIGETYGQKLKELGFEKVIQNLYFRTWRIYFFEKLKMASFRCCFRCKNQISAIYHLFREKLFQAYNLLGQFLLLNKDEELFKEWLKEEVGIKGKHLNDCNNCMAEWTRSYVQIELK